MEARVLGDGYIGDERPKWLQTAAGWPFKPSPGPTPLTNMPVPDSWKERASSFLDVIWVLSFGLQSEHYAEVLKV